ncbi:lysylphosphatidylglycerol synthase transmembrane domain-containing protein [Acidithiobacillus sp. IBUN Pt1247-S3]|uniref:lysylphosphatidylglycerol synthase transmembrane domain-containing protein n=1 Tax=Acidithiobacillus sp. IBUN Pt1247-S3 TaxID=3166642 RepID=UPI0034E5C89A
MPVEPQSSPIRAEKHRKKIPWSLLLQIVVTISIFVWLFHKTNWTALEQRFLEIRIPWFLLAVLAYAVNLSVSSIRWGVIIRAAKKHAPAAWLLRLNWVGAYFNQVLPGSVSGDVLRAWYTRPQTGSATLALAVVFADRFIGMGALVGIALLGYLLSGHALHRLPGMGETVAILSAGYVVIITLILSPGLGFLEDRLGKLGNKLRDIRAGMGMLLRNPTALAATVLLSIFVQVCSIFMFWALSHSLGERPDAVALWVVWPVVSLFLALPISLAGWGLREGLLVLYLGALQMGHDQALALSLLSGTTVLLASLPGAWLWLGIHRHPLAQRGHVGDAGTLQ